MLIHFPTDQGQDRGRTPTRSSRARGLILRQVGAYELPNALRMSVGTEEANRLVVQALAEFLGSKR